ELDEVLEVSDRIVVMYGVRLVGEMDARTADKNEVGLLMATGGRVAAAGGDDTGSGGDAGGSGDTPAGVSTEAAS
ncbi:MAG TPA: hypothetical protein VGI98_03875, partial [Candidatus Limnocylindrales bacterium]